MVSRYKLLINTIFFGFFCAFIGKFSFSGLNFLNSFCILSIFSVSILINSEYFIRKNFINKKIVLLSALFIIFFLWNFISSLVNNNLWDPGSYTIFIILVATSVFIASAISGINNSKSQIYDVRCRSIFTFFLIAQIPLYLTPYLFYGDDLINKNNIGMIFFSYISITLYFNLFSFGKRHSFFLVLIYLIALFFISSRTSIIGIFILLFYYFFHSFITKNRVIYCLSFIGLALTSFFSVTLIAFSSTSQILIKLNQASIDLFNKRILSGRDVMWPKLIAVINDNPFFGVGPSVNPGQVTGSGLSAHNIFLQIALQSGYIGLAFFLALLFFIWFYLYDLKNTDKGKAVISIFSGVVIINTFESTLTQNNFVYGLIFWVITGLALGEAIRARRGTLLNH